MRKPTTQGNVEQERYDYAFMLGVDASISGRGIETNPFDQESETLSYEGWLDGWASNKELDDASDSVGC